MINTLASTIELGAHPATALLLGGIAAAVLRGKYAAVVLVLSPLLVYFMFMEWNWELSPNSTFLDMTS